ncbi:hypothetical protein [Sphingobacterium thalpophilum]|uniref:hypothetical protein n=1 Tax=Sphingobacterium thalpophilum TaxID=259 RepID=UPI003C7480A5
MKRTILSIALITGITSFASAQLSVSKTRKMESFSKVSTLGVVRMELFRGINGTDTTYMLNYINNAFKQSTKNESFFLKASTEDMLNLEQLMLEVLKNKDSDENVSLKIGDKDYFLHRTSTMGFPSLMLVHSSDYDYTILAEKEIKKIFSPFHGDKKKK